MLAIGGMTVGELKERMSHAELMAWVAYSEECGPLNPMLRIDHAFARSVSPFLKNATRKDLMPWPKPPAQPEQEASLEAMFSIIKSVSKEKK